MVEPKLNGGTHTYVYVETSYIRNLPWTESHVYLTIMFDLFVMFSFCLNPLICREGVMFWRYQV